MPKLGKRGGYAKVSIPFNIGNIIAKVEISVNKIKESQNPRLIFCKPVHGPISAQKNRANRYKIIPA